MNHDGARKAHDWLSASLEVCHKTPVCHATLTFTGGAFLTRVNLAGEREEPCH